VPKVEDFNSFIKQMERADFAKVATTAESDTLTLGAFPVYPG